MRKSYCCQICELAEHIYLRQNIAALNENFEGISLQYVCIFFQLAHYITVSVLIIMASMHRRMLKYLWEPGSGPEIMTTINKIYKFENQHDTLPVKP